LLVGQGKKRGRGAEGKKALTLIRIRKGKKRRCGCERRGRRNPPTMLFKKEGEKRNGKRGMICRERRQPPKMRR